MIFEYPREITKAGRLSLSEQNTEYSKGKGKNSRSEWALTDPNRTPFRRIYGISYIGHLTNEHGPGNKFFFLIKMHTQYPAPEERSAQ